MTVPAPANLSTSGTWPVTGVTFEQFTGAADPFDLVGAILVFVP